MGRGKKVVTAKYKRTEIPRSEIDIVKMDVSNSIIDFGNGTMLNVSGVVEFDYEFNTNVSNVIYSNKLDTLEIINNDSITDLNMNQTDILDISSHKYLTKIGLNCGIDGDHLKLPVLRKPLEKLKIDSVFNVLDISVLNDQNNFGGNVTIRNNPDTLTNLIIPKNVTNQTNYDLYDCGFGIDFIDQFLNDLLDYSFSGYVNIIGNDNPSDMTDLNTLVNNGWIISYTGVVADGSISTSSIDPNYVSNEMREIDGELRLKYDNSDNIILENNFKLVANSYIKITYIHKDSPSSAIKSVLLGGVTSGMLQSRSGDIQIRNDNNTQDLNFTTNGSISIDDLVQLEIIKDGTGNIEVIQNGVSLGTQASTGTHTYYKIGRRGSSGGFFDGILKYVDFNGSVMRFDELGNDLNVYFS